MKGKKAEAVESGKRVRYTEQQKKDAINYIKQGMTLQKISSITNISPPTLTAWKREAGLSKSRGKGKKDKHVLSAQERIVKIDMEIAKLQEERKGYKDELQKEFDSLKSLIESL